MTMTVEATGPGAGRGLVDLLGAEAPRALIGGKAHGLARAARAGHRVPPGFVVTARAEAGPALDAEIDAHLERLGGERFAVRSSAAAEDGATRSFAGQLATELHVPRARVAEAVARCRASGEALRALRYAGGAVGPVAVLVQPMVPARAAGVAFSADPSTGERDVAILEAVRGLGDRLVSGEVDPESWRVVGATATRTRAPADDVLTAELAARIAEAARSLARAFGEPQDVEWALEGDELVVLQSRPITALPAAPRPIPVEIPKGSWERDDHHAVLSPLGWHWFEPYPKAMGRAMPKIGLPLEGVVATRIGGHLYLRFLTGGGESTAVPPRWVLWLVSRLVPAMRRADRVAREVLDGETYLEIVPRWEGEWRPAMQRDIARLFEAEPGMLDDEALLARIGEVLELTRRGLEWHAELGSMGMIGLGKLQLFAEERLGWRDDRVLNLVAGSSVKTTELHRQIEALVREHRAELPEDGTWPRTWAALAAQCPGLAAALADWLEDNRLRMMHYDPKHPTLGERPEYVLSIAEGAAHALREGAKDHDAHAAAEAILAEARAQLGADAAELDRLLEQARRLFCLRDENGIETVSRPAGLLRHFVLELGRRLSLAEPGHAVYLTPDEHAPALRGELADLAERIEHRRGEESWALRNRGPRRHGPHAPMPDPSAFPSGLARAFRIMKWFMDLETTPDEEPGAALAGFGIGARVVTGRARVVHDPSELSRLRHGEVVVCRITSPEWAVGLGRVAALVTEEGGGLSHPAIIARELGIPAVLGAAGALRRISTGDRVRVDPVAGTVTPAA